MSDIELDDFKTIRANAKRQLLDELLAEVYKQSVGIRVDLDDKPISCIPVVTIRDIIEKKREEL